MPILSQMRDLLLFGLAGFAASLVDGALGMGFGPTSSSILLGSGLAPTAVSTSVNLAKVVTGIAGAVSHWRFRNLDRELVLKLALPGCVGAVLGVTVLSNVNGATLRPYLAMLLTIIGLRILVKFAQPLPPKQKATIPATDGSSKRVLVYDRRGVKTAALIGGVTNGMIGAWGPVVTPFLLHRGVRPRFAVGSVNTAEVAVASASAFSLIASVGTGGFNGAVVVSMLLGGVVAAPVAAWMIRYVPPRAMGVAVAGLLLLTNARDLIAWGRITGLWVWAVYLGIIGLVLLAFYAGRGRTPTEVPPPPHKEEAAVSGRRGQLGAARNSPQVDCGRRFPLPVDVGSVTVKTAPPSTWLAAVTRPLWLTTIFCTMASPRPVPPGRLVKNG